MILRTERRPVLAMLGVALGSLAAHAQVPTEAPPPVPGAKPAIVERIKVHGAALEGNLEGNAADRDVLVVLPPSYAKEKSRRYPVVYALHGYSIGADQWSREIHVPQTIEGAFAHGAKEMIVVLPDSKTVHNGSMYSSSLTTGDFERFVARDLVAYIDAHYRTLPSRVSRGLVGHSMGGYGATRIGMKHADVFGSLYIMSPCCLSARGVGRDPAELEKTLAAATSPADTVELPFFARAQLAAASAWSPNPKNPPFYLDLATTDGTPRPEVLARWAANAPWRSWTSTSVSFVPTRPSPWTWATRTVFGRTPTSSTTCSTPMGSRTRSRSTRASEQRHVRTRAQIAGARQHVWVPLGKHDEITLVLRR
jgi:pimeloyl-ACP methyl ester carboxylesterase